MKVLRWWSSPYGGRYEYEKLRDRLNLWIVDKLPKRLVMWCYVRISGLDGNGPCDCFKDRLDRWGVK